MALELFATPITQRAIQTTTTHKNIFHTHIFLSTEHLQTQNTQEAPRSTATSPKQTIASGQKKKGSLDEREREKRGEGEIERERRRKREERERRKEEGGGERKREREKRTAGGNETHYKSVE